jgi:hypothetical protein
MAFRSNRLWPVISALAALVAVFVTVVIFFVGQRGRAKQLEAVVLSKTTLLNPDIGSARSKLRVIYQDKEVRNVSIIQVRLRNSGAQPIRSVDIEEPIQINLKGIEKLISAEIVHAEPPELTIKPSLLVNSVILNKSLLNPDDQFTLEIASVPASGMESSVHGVGGRIAGVKKIDFRATPQTRRREVEFVSTLSLAMTTAVIAMMVNFLMLMAIRKLRRSKQN